MLVGIVVLGIVELLDGAPFGASPLTDDAGEVVATPMVDPVFRTGLVVAGLLVLFVWGLYRMFTARIEDEETHRTGVTAD
ncbi:MAG: hypothetical protein V5A28_01175 [Haloarculaceae archaeon]